MAVGDHWISRLLGTLKNTFAIGPKTARATVTAASLTTSRTFTLPDAAGTVALREVTQSFTAAQTITVTDAVTNAVTNVLTLAHESSGTPAAGFGVGLRFQLESTTTLRDAGRVRYEWVTASDGSRGSKATLSVYSTSLELDLLTLTADTTQSVVAVGTGARFDAAAPGCALFHSTTQSIANSTATALLFNSEEFDTDAFHSTSSNTSRITIPTGLAGVYLLTAGAQFASNSSGARFIQFRVNGTTTPHPIQYVPAINGDVSSINTSTILKLVVGDYIEVVVAQSSGGALNVNSGVSGARFTATRLGT